MPVPREDADPAELVRDAGRLGLTLAVAESLTGGAVASSIVDVPGASAVLVGGIVAYDTALKQSLLGVGAGLLAERGAVDPEVAMAMAVGVRRACATRGRVPDIGVATTGVAGPEGQDGAAPGTVYIGVSSRRGERVHALHAMGDRAQVRDAARRSALAELAVELAWLGSAAGSTAAGTGQ